ncbi:hypothetical protein Hanom_Chr11g01001231 [Helianthus anomalus]
MYLVIIFDIMAVHKKNIIKGIMGQPGPTSTNVPAFEIVKAIHELMYTSHLLGKVMGYRYALPNTISTISQRSITCSIIFH